MYKKLKIILLPTHNPSLLYIDRSTVGRDKVYYNLSNIPMTLSEFRIPQHLYIVSDDEINVNDWIYQTVTKSIIKAPFNVNNDERFRKIIATTNTNLTIKYLKGRIYDPSKSCEYYGFKSGVGLQSHLRNEPMPQIPQDFIKLYCEKGGIDKVEVEYIGFTLYNDFTLIINSDNIINIKTIKDSYTREEVIELCQKAYDSGTSFKAWCDKNI